MQPTEQLDLQIFHIKISLYHDTIVYIISTSLLNYGTQSWCPYKTQEINTVERVQRLFTTNIVLSGATSWSVFTSKVQRKVSRNLSLANS